MSLLSTAVLAFDPTGTLPANKITNEQHILSAGNGRDYHFIVPKMAPFFAKNLVLSYRDTNGVTRNLVEGVDWYASHLFISASRACSSEIYGSISFLNLSLTGVVKVTYQSIGGNWTADDQKISEILADKIHNPRTTSWDEVIDMPVAFPVIDHEWDLVDMVGAKELVQSLEGIEEQLRLMGSEGLSAHIANNTNPHNVTKAQVGLGNVRDLPTATTAIAQAGTSNDHYMTPSTTKALIDSAGAGAAAHANNTSNPHNTTAAQVGAYTTGQVDSLLVNKLSINQTAYNSDRFGGETPAEFRATTMLGTSANSIKFNGKTYEEARADFQSGGGGDASTFGGLTPSAFKSDVLAGTAANANELAGNTLAELTALILAGTANNATNFAGFSFASATTEILKGTSANTSKFNSKTYAEVMTDVALQTVANSLKLDGRTTAELKTHILDGTALDSTKFNGYTWAAFQTWALANMSVYNSTRLDNRTTADLKLHILDGTAKDSTRFNGLTWTQFLAETPNSLTAANSILFDGMTPAQFRATVSGGSGGTADDSLLFGGLTPTEFTAAVLAGKAADSTLFNGMNLAQVAASVLQGKAADAERLDGYDSLELIAAAQNGTAANATKFANNTAAEWQQNIINLINQETTDNATQIGFSGFAAQADGLYWQELIRVLTPIGQTGTNHPDSHWIITGGESNGKSGTPLYLLSVSVKLMDGTVQPTFVIRDLAGVAPADGIVFGYTTVVTGSDTYLHIWAKTGENRSMITITELGKSAGEILTSGTNVSVEPSGIQYPTIDSSGLASKQEVASVRADLETVVVTLTQAIEDLRDEIAAS